MSRTVTIACKQPNGLTLRVHDMVDADEPVMGGGMKTVKRAVPIGDRVKINGTAAPFGKRSNVEIVGGYALTRNVPADFWNRWQAENKDSPLIRNHILFAHTSAAKLRGQAVEQEEVRSGLEPILPDGDPRTPKGVKKADIKSAA